MPTPEEIAQRRFLVALRGYDREQVIAFLDEVARHVAEVESRNAALAAELEEARAQLGRAAPAAEESSGRPFAALGEETQRVLEAAQEAGEAITRKSRQDADRQLQRARQQAAKVIAEAERQRDQVAAVVARLEERRSELAHELGAVGQTIEQLLADVTPTQDVPTVREALAESDEAGHADEAETPDGAAAADAPGIVEGGEGAGGLGVSGGLGGAGGLGVTAARAAADSADERAAPEGADSADEESAGEGADRAAEGSVAEAPDSPERVAAAPAPTSEPGATEGSPEGAPVAVTAPVPDPDADAGSPAREALAADTAGEPSSPVALRAGALEPLHPKMVRRLKRGMSDLQNLVLDRLRRTSGKKGAETLLPDEDELAVLAAVAEPFLDQAYEAGVEAAAVLAGRRLGLPTRSRSLEQDFAADGSERLRHSLLVSLRIGLEGDEPLTTLNDRVGAVFSEIKSTATDELSAIHLIRAYEFGLLDAWGAGGVAERTWVLGRELRCPEGRCRQNDETGAVDVSKAFASGHEVPPVHVGCTCTTIPVLES